VFAQEEGVTAAEVTEDMFRKSLAEEGIPGATLEFVEA